MAINNGGLFSRSSSSAIILDRSAPNPGTVDAHHAFPLYYDRSKNKVPNSTIVVAWTGFTDPESGIKTTSWGIGKDCNRIKKGDHALFTEVVAGDSVGGFIIENHTLVENETYCVCIRVTNGAGLDKTDCSSEILIVLGELSAGVISDGPLMSAKDIDFQLDDRVIWAHWHGFKDPVFDMSSYHWCIGDQLLNLSRLESCVWPLVKVPNLETKVSRFYNLTLLHGKKYYVIVKAENTRGDTVTSSSDGVIIDRTPPIARSIQISPSLGKETMFLTSPSAPVVSWSIDDPESGISHFLVSVGSFPFQSDLMATRYFDSLSRSVDLDQVNFTLYEGLTFYVTITGVNMLGLETVVTSQQVVVDWTPPDTGEIVDGNRTARIAEIFIHSHYQSDKGIFLVQWREIHDSESGVVEYHWCIGTAPGTCDVNSMTSAGLNTTVQHSIIPQEGLQYFFTVEATNGAGLKQAFYSNAITVDTSPPVLTNIYNNVEQHTNTALQVMTQKDSIQLAFYWDKPYDPETGISSVEWCAGTSTNSCSIVPLTSVDPEDSVVKHFISESLASGTVVFVTLFVTNGAGINSSVVTALLVIDTTPPPVGNVTVGNTSGTTYFRKGDLIIATWFGFGNEHSRFSHFEWTVCQASAREKCVIPYKNVGIKTTVNIDAVGIDYGVSYVVVVRAYNNGGLFGEATSNEFILAGSKPSAGIVYDGLERRKDIEFQSSTTQVSANWSPFTDTNGRITGYEMCVGTKPEICDVSGQYLSLGIKLSGTIKGLRLSHNGRYFVNVRATSESAYSTTATSNGVRIDRTPPLGGKVRDGQTLVDIDYQAADMVISANWDEFQDEESEVTGYTWCAGTRKGVCDVISETRVGDRTSASQQILTPLPSGISIFVTVSSFNNAGVSTRVSSDGFICDNTAPILSEVLDLQVGRNDHDVDYFTSKGSVCIGWNVADPESGVLKSKVSICSVLNIIDCSLYELDVGNQTFICLPDLEMKEGVKYVTNVRTQNNAGLTTELFSDGFMVDSTPPLMGEVAHTQSSNPIVKEAIEQFTHSKISVKWNRFSDKESGIRAYYVCVGTRPGECNSINMTKVTVSTTYTFHDLQLVHGETYFASVVAVNRAGLTSDIKTSDVIVADKTGPVNGGVILDGNKPGEDIDTQQSRILIVAQWIPFEDHESDITRMSWCAGLSSGTCLLVNETQLGEDDTFVSMLLTEPMMNGERYYVTVKATNGAGVTTSVTSDGVTIDDTPPTAGMVIDGAIIDVDYVKGEDDISASWSDFEDVESGIDSYEVALCDAWNLSSCPQNFTEVGNANNVTIAGLDVENGVQYRFIVRAMNGAGLKVNAISDGFTVDFTPPIEGKVWVIANNKRIIYHSDSAKVVASWSPFTDLESGISNYEVCVSSVIQKCTVTAFIDVGLSTSYTIDGLHLFHGNTYYIIVRGINRVGYASESRSEDVLIDLTPPTLKNERYFSGSRVSFSNNLTMSKDTQTSCPITFRCSEEHVTSSWEEFEDQESGIASYDWCVGTAKASCDVASIRSVGMRTRGAIIINRLQSGTKLFSTVYAVNRAMLRRQVVSDSCTVITEAPPPGEVIDVSSNSIDIDWKGDTSNLALRWNVTGRYLDEVSRLRIQVAVTKLSPNLSVPRLIKEMSWNGELLKQSFTEVLPWQRTVTIRAISFHPFERYRGIVRVWNEGGIFSEAISDGVKMEPSPPPAVSLAICDKAAENEHLRWWPNLKIPPVNTSALGTDITYISSPAKLELTVRRYNNNTNSTPEHNIMNGAAEFKIIVNRVTSNKNDTNTTLRSKTMTVIPGFADSEGPCCVKRTPNEPSALSDAHFKPASPTKEFGISLAVLPNDVVAIGCKGKVVLQSLKNRTVSSSITLDDHSNSNGRVKIVSYLNKTGFLLKDKVHLYQRTASNSGTTTLGKSSLIGKCKSLSKSHCSQSETWADELGKAFALSERVMAVTGTNLTTNNSVVAVFTEDAGEWMFTETIGEKVKDPNFGHSISLNDRLLAVAAKDGKNCCVLIYSIPNFILRKKICLGESANGVAPLSVHLTETDILVVLSKTSRFLKVFHLNAITNSYHEVCEYRAGRFISELSGNLDVNTREEEVIVAIGIKTIKGAEGVQLLGFQENHCNNPYQVQVPNECANLGLLLARESGLQVDGMTTRTSVSFKGNTILFGIPDLLTWPYNDQWLSTGRVFVATYCPSNYFRTTVSGLQSLRPKSCEPCEKGRKSFGGFENSCSVCAGRTCYVPRLNNSTSFTSGICDDASCVATSRLSNTTHGVNVHLKDGSLFVAGSEHVYTVELLETTRAGVSRSSFSESFVIDSTAPVPGVVYDGLGSDQNTNCSESLTFGENSRCSTRDLQDTDLSFTNNTREIHARWIYFLDNESDIIEYFWCVGTQPMRDDIRACESTGTRLNGSHYGFSLKHGDSYYVTVIACNGARICSAAHSDGVTIDTTPPVMTYVRDGIMGPDMDYQVFLDIIFAYFSASDPDSGVTSYEVAWGTGPNLVDVSDFEEVINITIWRANLKDSTLQVGKKYYATVRATNGAGLLSDWLSSDGIVVGKSEYMFDKNSPKASFFFDTVNVYDNGTRKDGGVGKTYGTLFVPEGAVEEKVKLRCYSLDEKMLSVNKTEEGAVRNPRRTKPKQFMLGNYSFQIKALDPQNNTVQEGFQFAKPVKLSMFYDVNNLIEANKEHVTYGVTKEDIDPVLYLWDLENETWFDAALTCPEPWSYVNHSMNRLEVNVCHLTQFAFFFSFYAQNGLVLLDKNYSIYDSHGDIHVSRVEKVTQLEIHVRRSKGSQGNITVEWSVYQNGSSNSLHLIQPRSGNVSLTDGQWSESFILNVDNEMEAPESVMWVKLQNPTGGALLASHDKTTAKILIASNLKVQHSKKIPVILGSSLACAIILLAVSIVIYKCRKQRERKMAAKQRQETATRNLKDVVGTKEDGSVQCAYHPHSTDVSENEMDTTVSAVKPEPKMTAANPKYDSKYRLTGQPSCGGAALHPLYESTFTVTKATGKVYNGEESKKDEGVSKI